MFEVGGLPEEIAVAALKNAQYKLPIKTKIVARDLGE
jgi:ribosomal protein L16/L10AE